MTSIRVGIAADGPPRPAYFRRHGLLELHPPQALPRPATMARWRELVPPSCEIALALARRVHSGKEGALVFERPGVRAWLDEAIRALAPRHIVLVTGADLSTGPRDRARLEAAVAWLRAQGPSVVWHPRGLWEHEEALAWADRVGCTLALDPLAAEPGAASGRLSNSQPTEPSRADALVYGRIEALGIHARLGEGHLRRALDSALATGCAQARLVVVGADAERKARRLIDMVDGLSGLVGGLSPVARRGANSERDSDENHDLDVGEDEVGEDEVGEDEVGEDEVDDDEGDVDSEDDLDERGDR